MHKYIIAHSHTRSCLYLTRPEIDPETMCSEPSMHTAARGRASRDTRGKQEGREKRAGQWVRAQGTRERPPRASWYNVQTDLR
jgi:hypothetical protein